MLDVLHFMFEEDTVTATREQFDIRKRFRTIIFDDMYGTTYAFADKEMQKEIDEAKNGGVSGSYGNMAPIDAPMNGGPVPTPVGVRPRRTLTRNGNHVAAQRGMVHKPYIKPTDMDIGGDPFKPFQGLDAPQF